MSKNESITAAIQTSLSNFTHLFEEVASDQFKEMRKCSFFDPVPSDCLAHIATQSEIKTFAAGEHITTEGGAMDAFYVLMYGSATAYYQNKVVGSIHSGDCIGEGTFFGSEQLTQSATVIPDGEVIVAEIKKHVVGNLEGEDKAFMDKALLLALFKKLQTANRKIEELLRAQ